MKDGWHIGVVIPARNEEAHVREVLEGLPTMVDVVVVVNDGSTDRTADIVKSTSVDCELILLEGQGDGVGASIDRGHQHLLSIFNAHGHDLQRPSKLELGPLMGRIWLSKLLVDQPCTKRLCHSRGTSRINL